MIKLRTDASVSVWQSLFLVLGSTWLIGPALNRVLSPDTTFISHYESHNMPYSWLFRLCDAAAGLLLMAAAFAFVRSRGRSSSRYWVGVSLLLIAACLVLDVLFTSTCQPGSLSCSSFHTVAARIHTVESVICGVAVFGLSLYIARRFKSLASTLFAISQVVFAAAFLTHLALENKIFGSIQFAYQALTMVWLAWAVRFMYQPAHTLSARKPSLLFIPRLFGAWAFINGVLAIILSLSHIRLAGFIRDIYFAGAAEPVAQHGVVIGVAMLYISRHLARGEYRARIIFLVLLGIETLKYSFVAPHTALLALYGLPFVALFVSRNYFDRNTVKLDWHIRLQEVLTILLGVATAVVGAIALLSRNPRHMLIARAAADEVMEPFGFARPLPHLFHRSALLAHTISLLASTTLLAVLWILFRPASIRGRSGHARNVSATAERLLSSMSTSSEDYFKLWPPDKEYFMRGDSTFVAFKLVGSVAFALADPVGPSPEARDRVLASFVAYARRNGWTACFLLVPESSRPAYEAFGMATVQIGASAEIDIEKFSTQTARNKWWRWQQNRGARSGYHYRKSVPPHDPALLKELRSVSDEWLSRQGRREQGFALGYFDEQHLEQCRLHFIVDDHGQPLAFTNELPIYNGLRQTTIDLLRFRPDAKNVMPFLLAKTICALCDEGKYTSFDLGFVPLAGIKNKLASLAADLGSRRFAAAGLARFKENFEPEWRAQYIAYDGDLADLAVIALNAEEALAPSQKGS